MRFAHTITIQRLTSKGSDFEDSRDLWNDIADVPAQVTPLGGRELIQAEQTAAQHTHRIRFRWGPSLEGFSTADRVQWGERRFNLTSVVNVEERNQWFECLAVESN